MQHHTVPCLFIFREHRTSERGISDLHAVLSCTGVIVCTNCETKQQQQKIHIANKYILFSETSTGGVQN